MHGIHENAVQLHTMRARTFDYWKNYINGQQEPSPVWCSTCDLNFEIGIKPPRCPRCREPGISILFRLDELGIGAGKELLKANPRPRGIREDEVLELVDRWTERLDAAGSIDEILCMVKGGLASPRRLDSWFCLNGDDWLRSHFILRKWDVSAMYRAIAEGSIDLRVRRAAAVLAEMPDAYRRAGWRKGSEEV